VSQSAKVAEGDLAEGIDFVATDAVVGGRRHAASAAWASSSAERVAIETSR
jgi:hypothetical protein